MAERYEGDIAVWAQEQAAHIRARRFDSLDLEHLADDIEDVGKSEQRDLGSRMAVLLAHRLKWQHQPERRGASWDRTVREQRAKVERRLKPTPSLRPSLSDRECVADLGVTRSRVRWTRPAPIAQPRLAHGT